MYWHVDLRVPNSCLYTTNLAAASPPWRSAFTTTRQSPGSVHPAIVPEKDSLFFERRTYREFPAGSMTVADRELP